MQTFKQVLRRKEERENLKQVGFCVAVVLVLVGFAFGLVHMKFLVEVRRASGTPNPAGVEVQINR